MDTKKAIHHWLIGAEKDWLACQHLFKSKDYSQTLFWGHLVLEKLLKGLIVQKTHSQPPYSHDLMLLAKKAGLELSQKQCDHLNEITTFNQFARYDNETAMFIEKCTPEYAKNYFLILKNLYGWLKKFFQKKS